MNLIVRTLAKPLVSWVTHYKKLKLLEQSESKFQKFIRIRLIWIGQKWNYYNVLLNRKLFKISTGSTTISDLPVDKALERGAEMISEFIVYSILILIPLMEWLRLSRISKEKEQRKEKLISDMRYELNEVMKENEQILKEMIEVKELLNNIENKFKT